MMNKEKNFVSAVLYVHNDQDRVKDFLEMIIRELEDHFEHTEIICVNDASSDQSTKRIREAAEKAVSTGITILNMSYFHGVELAMNAGVDLAIGDFVFEFDTVYADYDPSLIMEVYRTSLQGYDIVSASPDRKERFSSHLFYKVFRRFSDLSYEMTTESFRILSRRVINRISSLTNTAPYRKAVYAGSGLKAKTLRYAPTNTHTRAIDGKERKYRSALAVDSLILFTQVGYRLSMAMTLLMMFVSGFMILYSLITYFLAHPVEGWTTTILFLSVAFFGLFAILTIIVKYLQLLLNMVFKRKHYNFESIEKITRA